MCGTGTDMFLIFVKELKLKVSHKKVKKQPTLERISGKWKQIFLLKKSHHIHVRE
jgi:hypothetical protein